MSRLFILALTVSALIDLTVVLVLLLARLRERRLGPRRVVLAFIGAVFTGSIKAAMLIVAGLGLFGVMHLLYLDLFIVTPSVGLVVLALARGGRVHPAASVLGLAFAALLLLPMGFWVTWVEPTRLVLERSEHVIPAARDGVEPLRIGVLADLQTTRITAHERDAVDRLVAEKPDLILVPGDVYQGPWRLLPERAPAFREVLGRLEAPGGVFAVLGNTDTRGSLEVLFEGTGVRLLVNEIVTVTVRDRRVTIGGTELWFDEAEQIEFARELAARPDTGDIRLLLSHYPDALYNLTPGTRVDLVVAGHTHGGQVRIPGFGPPVTLSRVPREVAAGGLHVVDGRTVYVSRGVGMERGHAPRLRFMCPPEVSLITLYEE